MTIHNETETPETQTVDADAVSAAANATQEVETAQVQDGGDDQVVEPDHLKGMADAMAAAGGADPPRPGNEAEAEPVKADVAKKADKPDAKKEDANPEGEADPEKEADALGLKGKSRERFQQLNERVKTETTRAETAEAGLREWQDTIASTRATPEQFGKTMGYLRAVNSGDPAMMNQGFDILLGEVQALAQALGRPVPGVFDPLDQHADLKAAVDNMEIDRKHAEELAANRARQSIEDQGRQAADKQASDRAAYEQAQSDATTQLAGLGAQLRQQDPDFVRKFEMLGPTISLIEHNLHPSKWTQAFYEAYMKLPAMPVAAPAPAPVAAPSRQPIRPTGTNGSGAPKFDNPVDAMKFGIERARAAGL